MEPGIDWVFTFAVVIVGLVVVFVLLLLLVVLCTLMGKAFKKIDKNKLDKANAAKSEPPAIKAAAPVITKAVAVAPVVEVGIADDVVAAISAAIACVMGGDAKFALKSVKRSRGTRGAWNAAGIAENTQPF